MGNICSTRDEADLRQGSGQQANPQGGPHRVQNVFKSNNKNSKYGLHINKFLAAGPDYVIESKITLSQAAAENTEKIVMK